MCVRVCVQREYPGVAAGLRLVQGIHPLLRRASLHTAEAVLHPITARFDTADNALHGHLLDLAYGVAPFSWRNTVSAATFRRCLKWPC